MSGTIELVTFRVSHGDSRQFLDANAALSDWLKRQPGFVARHLAEREDGSFLDIGFWRSHEAALAASARLTEEMAQDEAVAMIDPMSIDMSHGSIRLSVE